MLYAVILMKGGNDKQPRYINSRLYEIYLLLVKDNQVLKRDYLARSGLKKLVLKWKNVHTVGLLMVLKMSEQISVPMDLEKEELFPTPTKKP